MAVVAFQVEPRVIHVEPVQKREWSEVLTPEASEFVARLARVFEPRRRELLAERRRRQAAWEAGEMPGFHRDTQTVRRAVWTVAPVPVDLLDRRVEITGPADRVTIIKGLNSGANVFIADLENATSPTWANVLEAQVNLRDALRREMFYVSADGHVYGIPERSAKLMVRPRAWDREEKHFCVDGRPVSASIFDFGLFFFHNARELVARGTGPYLSLTKLEGHAEASLWNDLFAFAQESLHLPHGTTRAAVSIDTVGAAFEMDEILYELREHSAGLAFNCSGYLSSFIRMFCSRPEFTLPERSQLTPDRHFLASLADLMIYTCHRRGAHAIAGAVTQAPVHSDASLNEQALIRVRRERLREVAAGFDGASVVHPAMVPVVREVFDQQMHGPNQIWRLSQDVQVAASDLLTVPQGSISETALRCNIDIAIRHLESWLRGAGSISIYNQIEDTATAEICRTQVWQWVRFGAKLDDGRPITDEMVRELVASQLKRIRLFTGVEGFHKGLYRRAAAILLDQMTGRELRDSLPAAAYDQLD